MNQEKFERWCFNCPIDQLSTTLSCKKQAVTAMQRSFMTPMGQSKRTRPVIHFNPKGYKTLVAQITFMDKVYLMRKLLEQ